MFQYISHQNYISFSSFYFWTYCAIKKSDIRINWVHYNNLHNVLNHICYKQLCDCTKLISKLISKAQCWTDLRIQYIRDYKLSSLYKISSLRATLKSINGIRIYNFKVKPKWSNVEKSVSVLISRAMLKWQVFVRLSLKWIVHQKQFSQI